jgi:hypothetical protein
MAVPKKRVSKSRSNARKATWKRQATKACQKSLALAKSIFNKKQTSFIYNKNIEINFEKK